MSFSGKVREELSENISQARHCRIAELAAFIGMCGTVSIDSFDRYHIKIHSENIVVARKVFTLLKKTFNIRTDISVKRNVKQIVKQIFRSCKKQADKYSEMRFVLKYIENIIFQQDY